MYEYVQQERHSINLSKSLIRPPYDLARRKTHQVGSRMDSTMSSTPFYRSFGFSLIYSHIHEAPMGIYER